MIFLVYQYLVDKQIRPFSNFVRKQFTFFLEKVSDNSSMLRINTSSFVCLFW